MGASEIGGRELAPGRARIWFLRLACLSIIAIESAWLLGEILRDRSLLTGWLFYLPSPVLALALIAAVPLALRWPSRLSAAALGLALMPLLFVVFVENRWFAPALHPEPSQPVIRVLHWNIHGAKRGVAGIIDGIRTEHPDLIALSELPREGPLLDALLAEFESADVARIDRLGVVAGEIVGEIVGEPRRLHADGELEALLVSALVGGQELSILLADVNPNKWMARGPPLARLRELIAREEPDLVLGDLNTPRRSLHFEALMAETPHAYAIAGHGWSYTYPTPVPYLAIDQAFFGPRLRAIDHEIRNAVASDHAIQILTVQFD